MEWRLSRHRGTLLQEGFLMYTSISVFLTASILLQGIVDVSFRPISRIGHLSSQDAQRPVYDPDDGSGRSFEQDKPRIDRFARTLRENPSAHGYIIAYGGLVSYKNEARIRLNCTRKYLIATHGIERSRLMLIDGGYRNEVTVELHLIKPEGPTPTAFPTVNKEAVRITKTPKHPCGKAGKAFRKAHALSDGFRRP